MGRIAGFRDDALLGLEVRPGGFSFPAEDLLSNMGIGVRGLEGFGLTGALAPAMPPARSLGRRADDADMGVLRIN